MTGGKDAFTNQNPRAVDDEKIFLFLASLGFLHFIAILWTALLHDSTLKHGASWGIV
jgi:hypothetical protein